MRCISEKASDSVGATLKVTLNHAERQKIRGLLALDDGSKAALLLPRGSTLRPGDHLLADDQTVIEVRAAHEELSVVRSEEPLELLRAAYHLGNRHVALSIQPGRLCYLHDHVLDDMVRALGLDVGFTREPFEPEPGAYSHSHSPNHSHSHSHSHDDAVIKFPRRRDPS